MYVREREADRESGRVMERERKREREIKGAHDRVNSYKAKRNFFY